MVNLFLFSFFVFGYRSSAFGLGDSLNTVCTLSLSLKSHLKELLAEQSLAGVVINGDGLCESVAERSSESASVVTAATAILITSLVAALITSLVSTGIGRGSRAAESAGNST